MPLVPVVAAALGLIRDLAGEGGVRVLGAVRASARKRCAIRRADPHWRCSHKRRRGRMVAPIVGTTAPATGRSAALIRSARLQSLPRAFGPTELPCAQESEE